MSWDKVGTHSGACIAVNLNERIDYFGSTVNRAARIQGLSDGRDIMVSSRLYAAGEGGRHFAGAGRSAESFQASLKGVREEMRVWKLAKG